MSNLRITLPVMMHFDAEIETFLAAKKRLEVLGEKTGVPLEVGAFIPFMPNHARKPENFEKQIKNQEKHKLPIWLVETGIYHTNAISYSPGNPTYDSSKPSDLERVIDQSARLRDLDPTAPKNLIVAPHVGIFVLESLSKGDFSHPSLYSVPDFVGLRESLYRQTKENFASLKTKATSLDLQLAIESSHLAAFENIWSWQKEERQPEMDYQVFNDLSSLTELSGGNIILDANHLAVNRNVPGRFKANNYDPAALFATMSINSWEEYAKKVGQVQDYLPHVHGLHISHVDGMGVKLKPGTKNGKLWGDGTGPDTTSAADYNLLLRTAQQRNWPVAIEQEFDLKPLTYQEADKFLEPVLKDYARRVDSA